MDKNIKKYLLACLELIAADDSGLGYQNDLGDYYIDNITEAWYNLTKDEREFVKHFDPGKNIDLENRIAILATRKRNYILKDIL